jgi:hypothetical protein
VLVCTFSERSGADVSRRDRVRHDGGHQRLRVDGLQQRIVADRDVGRERDRPGHRGLPRVGQYEHHGANSHADDCRTDLHSAPVWSKLFLHDVAEQPGADPGWWNRIGERDGSDWLCVGGTQQRNLAVHHVR